MSKIALTQAALKVALHYEPATGVFTRLTAATSAKVGDVAGSLDGGGYVQMWVNGVLHRGHRLAWLYMTGKFPDGKLDHENRKKNDNRWSNLRLATHSQNGRNVGLRSSNKSGFIGVSWSSKNKKWEAYCRVDGKNKYLGGFDTPEEASEAYQTCLKANIGNFCLLP